MEFQLNPHRIVINLIDRKIDPTVSHGSGPTTETIRDEGVYME